MSNKYNVLYNLLSERIMFLDGAMGTMIQRYQLTEADYRGEKFSDYTRDLKGNNDLLVLTRPDIISAIHNEYLEAGADIIETDSFNANFFSQSDYGTEDLVYEINLNAARIAREAADKYSGIDPQKPRFVAGSIGPTNRSASISPDVNDPGKRSVSFDELAAAYYEQIRGLADGGVDILLIETSFDTLNCKAAIFAAAEYFEKTGNQLPIIISGTIVDMSGRTLSGQTIEAFWLSISHAPNLLAVGINCSLGAKQMSTFIHELSSKADKYISLYPNAGLPNEFGGYDESPEFMADIAYQYADSGYINIIGGCCGTTPDHIRMLVSKCKNAPPRKLPVIEKSLKLSGLESLVFRKDLNFVNIGERTNVAGSIKFKKLIMSGEYEPALSVARQQVENGAQIIDVNMDDGMLDGPSAMGKFLNYVASEPDISKVPVMIDSSDWKVIETGLKCLQGKGIVNSISLKEGEDKFLEYARRIRKYGAAVVVMAFDEEGQAASYKRKIEICKRAYDLLTQKAGFPPEDIIFDPNILTIATGIEEHNDYALNYLEAVKWIKNNLPNAYVSGGVSNLSFSFRGNDRVREAMHSIFLYHAIKAGMDMGIVNAGQLEVFENIDPELKQVVEDTIFNRRADATERLLKLAENYTSARQVKDVELKWRELPVEERLIHALVTGNQDYIDEDTEEARLESRNALDVIEGPLMAGMDAVGELFGSGKMFLPQVVKSARVMKKSVAKLIPYIEEEKKNNLLNNSGKVLLATVKGDVHDIGKNIVGVVLSCNNYEVIDLGVMVPTDRIISEAERLDVDVIGLSGLITPSLEEMVNIASELEARGFNKPLLIGGATTSRVHTAVKIAPKYSKPVVHVLDASKSVPVVSNLLNKSYREEFVRGIKKDYDEIRYNHNAGIKEKNYVSLPEARQNSLIFDPAKADIITPRRPGLHTIDDFSIDEIRNYINWTQFFVTWEIHGKYPNIFNDPVKGNEARKLFEDANSLLDDIIQGRKLQARAVFGFFKANSVGDDIEIYTNDYKDGILAVIHTLRQQGRKVQHPNLALADYIAPIDSNIEDYIGLFALTAGIGVEELVNDFTNNNDQYNAIMVKILADRLAEAFAELLHAKVRNEYWGYIDSEGLTLDDVLSQKYRGIRPASGYPSLPDHTVNGIINDILKPGRIGMHLTESYMMVPAASVSGLYFAHPEAQYFAVGKILKDQVEDYRRRKGISLNEAEMWLAPVLAY